MAGKLSDGSVYLDLLSKDSEEKLLKYNSQLPEGKKVNEDWIRSAVQAGQYDKEDLLIQVDTGTLKSLTLSSNDWSMVAAYKALSRYATGIADKAITDLIVAVLGSKEFKALSKEEQLRIAKKLLEAQVALPYSRPLEQRERSVVDIPTISAAPPDAFERIAQQQKELENREANIAFFIKTLNQIDPTATLNWDLVERVRDRNVRDDFNTRLKMDPALLVIYDIVDILVQAGLQSLAFYVIGEVFFVGAASEAASTNLMKECFPADTQVTTEDGFKPIQSVRRGDQVLGYNLVTREWRARRVVETYEHDFEGDLVALAVEGDVIEATSNHPFWVVEGEGLEQRERPDHVPATPPDARLPGRWVDAGNLRAGDLLQMKSDCRLAISGLSIRKVRQKVYNLQIEEVHTYAVGKRQVLVHNKPAPLDRYNGPKSGYTNPGTHDPNSPNFVAGKTPLPADAEAVYGKAIPDPLKTSPVDQTWYGRSADGKYYRYQGTNGEVHFNAIVDWNDLPGYIRQRFGGLGFTK
jgi:hypothetical protein